MPRASKFQQGIGGIFKRPKSSNNEGQQHKLLVPFYAAKAMLENSGMTTPTIAKCDVSAPKLQTIAHAFFDKLYLAVPKEQVERLGLDEGTMTGTPRRRIHFHPFVTAYNFQELHNIAGSARSGAMACMDS